MKVIASYGRMRFCTDGGVPHVHIEGLDADEKIISDTIFGFEHFLSVTGEILQHMANDIAQAGEQMPH